MEFTPLASRQAAVEILVSCLDKGQPLDEALARHAGFAGLDPRDRAFVRLLLATTLRRLGEIDVVLGTLLAVALAVTLLSAVGAGGRPRGRARDRAPR